jgi:hypothetical protein
MELINNKQEEEKSHIGLWLPSQAKQYIIERLIQNKIVSQWQFVPSKRHLNWQTSKTPGSDNITAYYKTLAKVVDS